MYFATPEICKISSNFANFKTIATPFAISEPVLESARILFRLVVSYNLPKYTTELVMYREEYSSKKKGHPFLFTALYDP